MYVSSRTYCPRAVVPHVCAVTSLQIFLLGNGRLVLGDLGISKKFEAGGTARSDFTKTSIGTPSVVVFDSANCHVVTGGGPTSRNEVSLWCHVQILHVTRNVFQQAVRLQVGCVGSWVRFGGLDKTKIVFAAHMLSVHYNAAVYFTKWPPWTILSMPTQSRL